MVKLLAKYDPVLENLLVMPQGSVRYLSPTIQNELISLLAGHVKDGILSDIKAAPFFSLMVDTTQDIAKTDQLSLVIRYVCVETDVAGKPEKLKISESFIGFVAVDDQSASGLCDFIVKGCIDDNKLDITKLRGQGYDGAACMSGIYTGVQARILAKEPKAVYIHCAAHNLNLVLNDAVCDVKDVSNFFGVMEQIYVFFGHSITRWNALSQQCESGDHESDSNVSVILKRLCPTRWSSRHDCLVAIRFQFVNVLKVLTKIILTSKKKDEVTSAVALKKKMERFDFVFILVMMTEILQTVHGVSKLLQSAQCYLIKASVLLKASFEKLQSIRDKFEHFRDTAANLAKAWGVTEQFEDGRVTKKKRFVDELCEDERLMCAEKRFRVSVFLATVDKTSVQLKQRFLGLDTVASMFNVLLPSTLTSLADDELHKSAIVLAERYNTDISPAFPTQLLSFRACFQSILSNKSIVFEVAELLMIDHFALSSTYSGGAYVRNWASRGFAC